MFNKVKINSLFVKSLDLKLNLYYFSRRKNFSDKIGQKFFFQKKFFFYKFCKKVEVVKALTIASSIRLAVGHLVVACV